MSISPALLLLTPLLLCCAAGSARAKTPAPTEVIALEFRGPDQADGAPKLLVPLEGAVEGTTRVLEHASECRADAVPMDGERIRLRVRCTAAERSPDSRRANFEVEVTRALEPGRPTVVAAIDDLEVVAIRL